MALTTTAGGASSDAFVTIDYCDAYCEARGITDWTSAPDSPADDKEAAIRRATDYLSNGFGWKGYKTSGRTQALAWPRTDAYDAEGETIASDEIPVEVMNACCEVAARELVTPGYTSPDVILTDRVKSEQVDVIRTEYVIGNLSAEASRPVLLKVRDMVAGLISGSASSIVGSASRA